MTSRKQFLYTAMFFVILVFACLALNWHTNHILHRPLVFDIGGRSFDFYRSIMIKSNDYDAIICGSSMSTNFRCSEFDSFWGTNSLKIAKNGTNTADFCIVCAYALNLKNVKYVQVDLGLGMSLDSNISPDQYSSHFSLSNFFKESFSFDNAQKSIRFCFAPPKQITRDDYGIWYKETPRNEAINSLARIVLANDGKLASPPNMYSPEIIHDNEIIINKTILPLIKKYPQTTFLVFIPPYSMLHFYQQNPQQIIQYRNFIYDSLLSCRNVKLYDFQTASDITENLCNYKDPTHYMEHINSWIIEQIAKNNYLITQQNANFYLNKLLNQISSYDFEKASQQLKKLCPDWQKRDN